MSSLWSWAQMVEVHNFSSLDRSVPDGNASGLSDVRTVPSAVVNISSVRLKLRVAGEFNGDLYGYVRHVNAAGTNLCVLLNRPGRTAINSRGYNNEGLDVTFDDTAANGDIHDYQSVTNVPAGSPLTGFWKPDGRTNDPASVLDTHAPATSLSLFMGADANGEWTLFLADLDSGATNMLLGWEIELAGATSPAVSWPAPVSITYGTALDGGRLNASSPVAGTFSYIPAAGTMLHAGLSQTLTGVFTPNDPASYNSVTSYVSIDVLRQALIITAEDKSKFYGEPLPIFTANYSGFVNADDPSRLGTPVVLTCAATGTSDVGTYSIAPSDAASPDYNITFVNGTLTVNPPPVLEPISDQTAYVLMPLVLTNRVSNSNQLSQPLTFGLEKGAPNGVRVNPTNGVFLWRPTRAQARSTNVITVWMTDSGSPPVDATNTFTVVVDDYLELALGQAVLRPGQTGSVPVTLVTTTGLTNLQALVQVPEDRLIPMALTGWAPEVGNATLQQQGANVWQMEFTAAPGQALQRTQELARLNFLAITNRSAFVPLASVITTNLQTNGLSVWRTLTDDGRVVVVEQEPLVEALPLTNALPNLILYGIAGISYELQFSPVLPAVGGWQPVWLGTVPPNLWIQVSGLTNTGPPMFFRAQEGGGP